MAQVYVGEVLERGVVVDVSDDELRILRGDRSSIEYSATVDVVLNRAGDGLSASKLEWVSTHMHDEDDDELFSV